jgi:hypothetical protein
LGEVEQIKFQPTTDFEIQVREEFEKEQISKPEGNISPQSITSEITTFKRNAVVKAWVLKEANGICECCNNSAPFNTQDGIPYLEVHHLRRLADNGSDTVSNAIAVCTSFQVVEDYSEGLASVFTLDTLEWVVIDKTGNIVINNLKNKLVSKFSEGLAATRFGDDKTGKYGFIDKKGNVVIKPQDLRSSSDT